MITVTMSVATAEKLLNTSFFFFKHPALKGKLILRAAQYHLPEHISKEVTMVGDILQFPHVSSDELRDLKGSGNWPDSCESAGCSGLVTPAVLAQRYKIPTSNAAVS